MRQVLSEGGVQELGRAVTLAAVQLCVVSTHPARGTASCTEAARRLRNRLVVGEY